MRFKASRRLMADDSKTLNQVIADVKAAELTKQQDEIMQKSSESASVEAINAKARGKRPKPKPISKKPFQARDDRNTKPASQNKKACHRCGSKQSHPLQECRARNAICYLCSVRGHLQSQCRTKRVNLVESDGSGSETPVDQV